MEWQNLTEKKTAEALGVKPGTGLSAAEVLRRSQEEGANTLQEKKGKSLLLLFLEQFTDFMVIVLLAAAGVSCTISFLEHNADWVDSIIILVIVVVNAIIGVVQERKAEKAIEALKKMSAPETSVRRNGEVKKIRSEELVRGDVVLLKAGDLIPADIRILEAYNLKAEESSLTGESVPVEKQGDIVLPDKTPLAERRNLLFATGVITSGRAVGIVVETGMSTQVGKIAAMINAETNPPTPLQRKLAKTGKLLGIGVLIICAVIFILGLLQSIPALNVFMISVSLAVAAIPEGLPAVVTIVLAVGVQRMARNNAIIRKLPAVETLGSATVICSDKTGTLTQNKMTVTALCDETGELAASSPHGKMILECAALCNNSTVTQKKGKWEASGDPTENALVLIAAQRGIVKHELEIRYPRVSEVPFDSSRKMMTTVHKLDSGRYRVITKGAPEYVMKACDMPSGAVQTYKRANERMAGKALRVLAVAYKDVDGMPASGSLESGLTLCGMAGMIDPPRPEVKQAVKICREAGIRPVMITGDNVLTASAIAKELGILSEKSAAVTGAELDAMSQTDLTAKIEKYNVFARVTPEHKVRVVKAFQARGHVVAMTGDGVNDAPAIKAADIGCAMGISGTEVTKGAADMVLADDNFATIVEAVREGRGIYDNIKKAVHFLLSCNIGEILTIFIAFICKLPTPLLAIQLLWVNLVTDSLPALALGGEKPESDIMTRKPHKRDESLFSNGLGFDIIVEGALIAAITLFAFLLGRFLFDGTGEPTVGRTLAFVVLSLSQLVHAFNVRSDHSLFKIGFFNNTKMVSAFLVCTVLQLLVVQIPQIAAIFKTVPLTAQQWLIGAGIAFIPLVVVEISKMLKKD